MSATRTIIVVTDRELFPVNAGNRARIVSLLDSLRALGFVVVLVTRRTWRVDHAWQASRLADHVIGVRAEAFRRGSPVAFDYTPFLEPLRAAVDRFNPVAVIAEYIWMAPCLDVVRNGAVRLLDTIDLMHRRQAFGERLSDVWVTCTRDQERELLEKADVVMAIQANELDAFRDLVPDRPVICVPHYMPVSPVRTPPQPGVVTMVASGNPGNVEGLTAFLEQAWPTVRRLRPDAELRIVGQLAERVFDVPGVTPVGFIDHVSDAYRDAAVIINPVRFGTGLKIKTVEALGYGKAVVTTSCGVEGLESAEGHALIIEDDMSRFGEAVARLLDDATLRRRLEDGALSFARTEFCRDRVYASLLDVLAAPPPKRLPARHALLRTTVRSSSDSAHRAPAPGTCRPLRVLASPAFANRATNPYNWLLYTGMTKAGMHVEECSARRVIRGGYDVWHLHWPEASVNTPRLTTACVGAFKLLLLMLLARLRGIRTVWTMHNLAGHEEPHPRLSAAFRKAFVRLLDGHISLSSASQVQCLERFPALRRLPGFVVRHGHYRDVYPNTLSRQAARARLKLPPAGPVIAFVGQVRAYKNIPALVRAFARLDDPAATLIIAGEPRHADAAAAVHAAAAQDGRVRLHLQFVTDDDVELYMNAADLLVFPFEQLLNSGSVMLALSFNRPVLVPALPSLCELQAQVGREWVHTYEQELTPEILRDAIAAVRQTPPADPARLDEFEWPALAAQTVDAFRVICGGAESRRPAARAEGRDEYAGLSRRAASGIAWIAGGKVGFAVLQALTLVLLARLLTPRDFGVAGAALVVIGLLSAIESLGLGAALVQHPQLTRAHVDTAIWTSPLIGLTVGLVVWVAAPICAQLMHVPEMEPMLRWLTLMFPLKSFGTIGESMLQRQHRFQRIAALSVASYAVGYMGVGVAAALAGWGPWALAAANVSQVTLYTAGTAVAARLRPGGRPRLEPLRDLARFGGGQTLGSIGNQVALQIDNLVVGRMLGPAALGLYSRAYVLMAEPASMLAVSLTQVLFPLLSSVQHERERLASIYRKSLAVWSLLSVPMSIVCSVLAVDVVRVVLGPQWSVATTTFQILALGMMFRVNTTIADCVIRAAGAVYKRAWRRIVYAAAVLIGALAGSQWGLPGVAAGVLGALILDCALMSHLALHLTGQSWRVFAKAHAPAAFQGLVLAASLMALRTQSQSLLLPPAVALALAGVTAAAVIGLLLLMVPRWALGSDGFWAVRVASFYLPARWRPAHPEGRVGHAVGV